MASDLKGFQQMLDKMSAIKLKVDAATGPALGKAAHLLEGAIKIELGRTSHPPGTPTPSPPGSPPSLVTGNLRRSIQVEGPQVSGLGRWSVSTGAESVYARVQELGGGPSRLPARPYMAPALAASLPAMGALIEQAWARALK